MSVPGVLRLTPTTVPADVPYLAAEPGRIATFAARFPSGALRIGINWASGPSLEWYRRKRDIPLAAFASLAALPGTRLVSLQHGEATNDLRQIGFQVENLGEGLDADGAFVDRAAVMQNLDLVVTCDTSIAHLAGALARPVFTALPLAADWRYGVEREDCPWYPTMRLFRQSRHGEWDDVFARIADAAAAMPRAT